MFEIKSKPMKIRISGDLSGHWQTTIPVELRKRFNLTIENAHDKQLVFLIKSDGKVEVECVGKEKTHGTIKEA